MANPQERRIAVLGDPATVLGFRGLGLESIAVESVEELQQTLKQLVASEEYGILYLTNALAEQVEPLLKEWQQKALPAIIPIPMGPPAAAIGQLALKEAVRKAVGFDILANQTQE